METVLTGLTGSKTGQCPPSSGPRLSLTKMRTLTFWVPMDSHVPATLPWHTQAHKCLATAHFLASRTQMQKAVSGNLCKYVYIRNVGVPDKPVCVRVCVHERERER